MKEKEQQTMKKDRKEKLIQIGEAGEIIVLNSKYKTNRDLQPVSRLRWSLDRNY